ncbi:tyrosine-protein phosphatase non-receptor type 18 isoform X2 [Melanotaenia boesemani]|uniref:tyrosine-protein phosphatase non-receptor type 18 isoform X2 n=1 Tax=Melanotaenia boesemani TaxID=1250792 RepID=UPI001C04DCD0|nr:tyrosine-protein phosphatase non-receptor type 18 isoform X2 [Melanotaenia boesemani]
MELLPSLLAGLKAVDHRTVEQEFNVVRSESLTLKRELGLTTETGALKENIKKNRYKDILPYDQSRVVLSLPTGDSSSDYINASFIKGASGGCRYVACQGPLSSTVTDFWRMIWQLEVKVIVMACREIEMGKRKCECYWAAAQQSAAFGPFTVGNQGESRPNEDVVVRSLTVSFQQETRSVVQYQFLSWPDHDVPYETGGVLDLLERARTSQGVHSSPLMIHCSAGCGRTGVICALDYIHDLLVTKHITAGFSILKIVLELRRQRPSAVQTKDQYQFIFTAIISMLERFLQESDQQLYSNLPELKKPEKKTTRPASSVTRSSQQLNMNDTYAVVNKPKQPHLSAPGGGSRTFPATHHYDNDPTGAPAAPIYSTVKPRAKQLSQSLSASPIYDLAAPTNHKPTEGADLLTAAAADDDDDYEDISSSVPDTTSFCSPGGIGFNCRVRKPRGPRDPPAEWSRLER